MNEEMKCDNYYNYYYKHSMLASDDDTVAMERTSNVTPTVNALNRTFYPSVREGSSVFR